MKAHVIKLNQEIANQKYPFAFLLSSTVGRMSIANTAAQAMLSDALLRDSNGDGRIRHLELDLPLDKVIKFISVGLPLLLVSMAFAREISIG